MATLRITQTTESTGQYRVEIALEGDGLPRQTATASFPFTMTEQDQKDLRWYLEDYLQFPQEPAPKIAARVEQRIADIGTELFKAVFQSSDAARDLWATLRTNLNDMRVEIITGVEEAASIPWELIRDPRTDRPLALYAQALVRAHPQAAQRPRPVDTGDGTIRILLVICRPGASDDVPFRSVASRLMKGLGDEARALFQLDVLRPPTFEQLARVLRRAKNENKPYHVVHFDGHGVYLDAEDEDAPGQVLRNLMPLLLSGPRTGSHGYLVFENPDLDDNTTLVDGPAMGNLLVETNVPVLVLNACRSAHAEAPDDEQPVEPVQVSPSQVRVFGSLAQEVIDAGVWGVVAMRYNVYVVTAAQFVAELYATLAQGRTLGQAVTLGRKGLADKPMREIAYDPLPLQDWSVPVVFEAAPIALFPEVADNPTLTVNVHAAGASAETGSLDTKLPKPPDAGFFGRDETLLALDRAFDTQSIVLLHAYAGSGKTTTAAEFARWYALTGGIQGPVLLTSFEQYLPLARVLDRIGDVFGPSLEQADINWLALDDEQRREVALQVLRQRPVLWIWDNVEPVSGFPTGTASSWSDEEQRELVDFLRDARQTQAKFLLTSRRSERAWLGDALPRRIQVPPMPMQERVQLARAIAERHGRRLTEVDDWRPLLRFTDGNPLTITVLVGQALRDGLKTKAQIETFVSDLRAGEAKFTDEEGEGRTRSLGASLSYGFEHAFSQDERGALALLHFFQGFANVDVLREMGHHPEADWCVPAVRGLTKEAGMALLDRAAEIGLLTSHGDGYYAIHPALPWAFKSLFEEHYRQGEAPDTPCSEVRPSHLHATRAFVEAMGELGNYYHNQYDDGNRDVIAILSAEEANLLYAWCLARTHGWWHSITSAMQGLHILFEHTGRRAEWARLVGEIVPDFVDLATDGPLSGREEEWDLVTHYRVGLTRQARQWTEAERLQRAYVDWNRQIVEGVVGSQSTRTTLADWLETAAPNLDNMQRNAIRTLAVALEGLGQVGRELQKADCVATLEEALALSEQIGDRAAAAICAVALGDAYKDIVTIRALANAEHWYRRSLGMHLEHDGLGRARCLMRLGEIALSRFREARDANEPEVELRGHVNTARQSYLQALQELPQTAVPGLAATHNALGGIYRSVGDVNCALTHYREALRYCEEAGDLYGAAVTRFNVARAFISSGRLADALEYARAALHNYETYGDGATQDVAETQQLITQLEQLAQEG